MVGTILGAYGSSFSASRFIFCVYILVCLMALYFINHRVHIDLANSRLKPLLYITFAFIGAISATVGVGGAVQFATALKCFSGKTTKMLLPTITLLVAIHAFFAFASKLVLGFVTLQIIPIAIIASLLGAKAGIKISKRMTSKTINIWMSSVLCIGLLRILWELFK
jgi:uncharacterized membrane protein YfcA